MRPRGFLYASLLALATVATIACALPFPSVYSLAPEDDLVFDPVLLGHWVEPDEDNDSFDMLYTLTRPDDDAEYEVEVLTDDCEIFAFEATLADLGTARFLIATADEDEVLFSMPTFSFFRVEVSPNVVDLTMIDPDWLAEYLASNPEALSHLRRPDADDDIDLLLTASTAELRDFHLTHLETPAAWSEAEHYERRSADEAAALRARWCAEPNDPDDSEPDVNGADPDE